jgi:hypothetical protein
MKYCLCVKENDKNLLHIITAKDLKKPLYRGFKKVAVAFGESEAYEACARLIEDFCKLSWDKGENPDFGGFKAWISEVFLNEKSA